MSFLLPVTFQEEFFAFLLTSERSLGLSHHPGSH